MRLSRRELFLLLPVSCEGFMTPAREFLSGQKSLENERHFTNLSNVRTPLQTNPMKSRFTALNWLAFRVPLFGLGMLVLYLVLAATLLPYPIVPFDSENFSHWEHTNYTYTSSAVDLSVMSPFQGMGGLVQPLGVWISPAYILPHLFQIEATRAGFIFVGGLLMGLATFLLGRANGLKPASSVVAAQTAAIFSFPPMYVWVHPYLPLNGCHLYDTLPAFSVPTALATLMLAVFSYLGTLSLKRNLLCVVLLPGILIYSILCDPLYTALFFIPAGLFMGGIFFGSGTKKVFVWRAVGGVFTLIVCLLLNLQGFYRALSRYAARAVFPNELYVEVQQWDYYTALFFQGGLTGPIVILLLICCLVTIVFGISQTKGLAVSVILFVLLMIGMSVIYVYGGLRWNQPVPSYLEAGAHPTYIVVGIMGFCLGIEAIRSRFFPARTQDKPKGKAKGPSAPSLTRSLLSSYWSVLILPVIGIVMVVFTRTQIPASPPSGQENSEKRSTIVTYLQEEIGLGKDGRFRGSVASVLGVPGGELMRRMNVPDSAPFTKDHIGFVGYYFRSFDRNFYMTGLWNSGIPTLEDNNHLVTPVFHFLISRTLARPQDFHSRNWAVITKARPKLMAAMGVKYLLCDTPQDDGDLALRAKQTNQDNITVYAYEINGANLGNLSPTETLVSANASETISWMTNGSFSFDDTAIIHDGPPLKGLTKAHSGALYYERGGVRVKAASSGPALIVLPVQFSNSLRITEVARNSTGTPIRLIRVNLLQVGVLFDGEIDFKFQHVFGPFRGVAGRLKDIADCERLGIKETGEIPYPPNYQPLSKHWFR